MENSNDKIKLNIYQKLHKIQCEVLGLGKDGKSYGYQYVTGTKVIDHIKPLMNELGLLLKQEILNFDNTRQDYQTKSSSKSEILTRVEMKFTWIDVETGEKDENLFGANGQNDWEKGLGSALTYAERYFLLKYFHISTDEDDIDNPERKTEVKTKKKSHQSQASNTSYNNSNASQTEKPWLNKMQGKDMSKHWLNAINKIQNGTITSVSQIKMAYKVSKEIESELQELFNSKKA